jgi:hypothetical protein
VHTLYLGIRCSPKKKKKKKIFVRHVNVMHVTIDMVCARKVTTWGFEPRPPRISPDIQQLL